MLSFGEWIRETRESKGFNANFCARRAGMHESVWSNWENGRSRRKGGEPTQPRPETVRAIAKGLGVPEQEAILAAYGKEHIANATTSNEVQKLDISELFVALDVEDRDEIIQIMQMKWQRKNPGVSPPRLSKLKTHLLSHRILGIDLDDGYLYKPDGELISEEQLTVLAQQLGRLAGIYGRSKYSPLRTNQILSEIRQDLEIPDTILETPTETGEVKSTSV